MEKKIKILYVDDEEINLQLFNIIFSKKYDILTALSGSEGIKTLQNNTGTNVVVSDMKMPGMNGLEFIRLAKKDFPDIAFYILTGFDITNEILEALKNKEILKYFRKPCNLEDIEAAIHEHTTQ